VRRTPRSRKAIQGIDRGSVRRRQLAHIHGAEFILLPEAAHSINWERPEAFNGNVPEFVRKHYPVAAGRLSF
jgi:pimeloyl-ACP methyl ester carboxylesterase